MSFRWYGCIICTQIANAKGEKYGPMYNRDQVVTIQHLLYCKKHAPAFFKQEELN